MKAPVTLVFVTLTENTFPCIEQFIILCLFFHQKYINVVRTYASSNQYLNVLAHMTYFCILYSERALQTLSITFQC